MHIFRLILCCGITLGLLCANVPSQTNWSTTTANDLLAVDDDFRRHRGDLEFFNGLEISENRFSENGFDWHLIRFVNSANITGPMWLVPHDDENAAFDSMVAAIKTHGGIGIAVNSGTGSVRMQSGYGRCGVNPRKQVMCDPNRNFDSNSPKFTSAIMDQYHSGQPIIAFHTNSTGFAGDGNGGRGEISMVDKIAFRRGELVPRSGGLFAVNPDEAMANFDTLALIAYLQKDRRPSDFATECGRQLSNAGIHFWHERVAESDGSMSNYLALNRPEISYLNIESRAETDLAIAAKRHSYILNAYLERCFSRDKPTPQP